jgi:hypothetical protein
MIKMNELTQVISQVGIDALFGHIHAMILLIESEKLSPNRILWIIFSPLKIKKNSGADWKSFVKQEKHPAGRLIC